MIVIRLLAVLAWLIASTLSVSASEHDVGHQDGHSQPFGHEAMSHDMMEHDHAAMMKAHHAKQDHKEKEDCEDTCCESLCLCEAVTVSAAIEPSLLDVTVRNGEKQTFRIAHSGADPGLLLDEGPPPRFV